MERQVDEAANFIVGHGGDSVSERYGARCVKPAAKTIAMSPRYQIATLDVPPAPHKRRRRTCAQIAADEAVKAVQKVARARQAAQSTVRDVSSSPSE